MTRAHGGLGLGMAIVRHLVELHGGTVQAESAGENCGATFTVTLPIRVNEEPAEPPPAQRHEAERDVPWAELIDEVLDLAKIESGTVDVKMQTLPTTELRDQLDRTFGQLPNVKDLEFQIVTAPDVPPTITTDPQRLLQILKNLLSNAFKFTEKGSVTLEISLARAPRMPDEAQLATATRVLAFSVIDTGIGIPQEKHEVIFDAFRQADGTTSRKYGGTGLGLSISRALAHLLGGEIRMTSNVGQGSRFMLYHPQGHHTTAGVQAIHPSSTPAIASGGFRHVPRPSSLAVVETETAPAVADDRDEITAEDKVVLIVEKT